MIALEQAVDRLTFGSTAELVAEIRAQGVSDWLDSQLRPGSDPEKLNRTMSALDAVSLSPEALLARYRPHRGAPSSPEERRMVQMQHRMLYRQSVQARLYYAVASPWQLRELLVDFWFNHFNVFAHKGLCALWTGAFEQQAIRPNVLGRFEDLLLATARHPAMLFYLDNWRNAAPGSRARGRAASGLNENYAREVMELHTVGLHYTQDDVAAATRLLSGWGLDGSGSFRFFPRRHDFNPQRVLGQRFEGGADAVGTFLRYLARHPDTARHLASKMAQYFVADQPPAELVQAMADSYRSSDGDLRVLTRTMIDHPEFAAAATRRDKLRTPYRYVVALLRASGRSPDQVQPLIGSLNRLGQPLYGCIQPNGWPCTQSEWLSPDALSARINFAVALGGGWLEVDSRYSRGEPVALAAVLEQMTLPAAIREQAAQTPPHLQASVLLGSPRMQYC